MKSTEDMCRSGRGTVDFAHHYEQALGKVNKHPTSLPIRCSGDPAINRGRHVAWRMLSNMQRRSSTSSNRILLRRKAVGFLGMKDAKT